jgi:hypothetical protein
MSIVSELLGSGAYSIFEIASTTEICYQNTKRIQEVLSAPKRARG